MKKASYKITTFVLSMIWISFFAITLAIFISSLATNYGTPYDSSTLKTFNKTAQLQEKIQKYENATKINERSDLNDIIGAYFSRGYVALQTTTDSLEVFGAMKDDTFNQLNLPFGQPLQVAITLSIFIIIFIGIVLSAIIKRDL